MNANKILLPAITGTSLMTLFSYLISTYENENFSEPELLAAMGKDILPHAAKHSALPAGWVTHYGIGVLITSMYKYFDKNRNNKLVLRNGILLGGLSGIAGVAMWKLFFRIHPAPPSVPLRKFFIQLLWVHLVFGITVSAVSIQLSTPNKTFINLL